jgi:hypothetical protein
MHRLAYLSTRREHTHAHAPTRPHPQERLRASMQSVEDASGRKMRSVVTHKKLKDIAAAQATEVHALSGELDRLRKRTYPTFVENQLAPLPPDAKAGLWKK